MQQPFTILRLDSVQFNILETFFAVYGGGAENINDQREKIFCYHNSNPELIPPTQNALFHHCQRALYQASVWVSANRSEMKAADPLEFGWKELEKRLVRLWMSIVHSESQQCLSGIDQVMLPTYMWKRLYLQEK